MTESEIACSGGCVEVAQAARALEGELYSNLGEMAPTHSSPAVTASGAAGCVSMNPRSTMMPAGPAITITSAFPRGGRWLNRDVA